MKPAPVIFNHSAAIDGFVATALLAAMPEIELKGVIVTNADCVPETAMQVSWKVHQFLGLEKVPLGLSNARGWNAFPWSYRADCIKMDSLEILKSYAENPDWPPYPSGEDILRTLLLDAVKQQEPVRVLITGPLTTIANVISAEPHLLQGIDEVIWMGGAIYVPGNLDPTMIPPQVANTHAEWNAFWDPFAVETMFRLMSMMRIFPLDITNQAHITKGFMQALQRQDRYPYSRFVYEACSLLGDEPFYEMWNTLTSCYLAGDTAMFSNPVGMALKVTSWGFEQGRISNYINGSPERGTTNMQWVYLNLDKPQNFYDFILEKMRR